MFRNQDKRSVYLAVGGSPGDGSRIMLGWLERNFAAIKDSIVRINVTPPVGFLVM